MKTYWVEYTFTYDIFFDGEWETEEDFDAGRFNIRRDFARIVFGGLNATMPLRIRTSM